MLVFSGVFLITRELDRVRKTPEELRDEETVIRRFPFTQEQDLEDWDHRVISGGRTSYKISDFDGEKCLIANSEDTASAIFYRHDLDHERGPYVSWEWKAVEFPRRTRPEDLSDRDEFDFVAQIYVVFDARFLLNARAIQYLWAEETEVGTVQASPYTDNIRLVVLRSGPSEEWALERRNIEEDYLNFFGEELSKGIQAVAIMTDADSTSSEAKAVFRNMEIGYSKSEPQRTSFFQRPRPGEVEVKTDREPRRRGRFLQ